MTNAAGAARLPAADNARATGFQVPSSGFTVSSKQQEQSCGIWRCGPRSSWVADRSGSHRTAPRHRPAEGAADLWVVLEGGGTLTTGGVLEKGKILGGQSRPIKVGDVVYIPSGLPHGVSGVDKNITWLNVRWDTDWPPDSPMGAGTLNGLLGRAGGARAGAPGGAREGAVEARAARAGATGDAAPPAARGPVLPPGSQQTLPYSYGGSGELFFAKEQLDQIMAGMRLKKSTNTRLIEGGRYNVNLRWNGTPTVELHGQTIDTWVVLAGGATVNTGYEVKDGERVPNTGVSVVTKPGDVFFHPSAFYHGFSQVSPDIFWLNIRWDDNYAKN